MYETERIIAAISIVWAAVALVVQVVRARGLCRKDYSVRAGSVIQGIIYNFTYAMLPKHKETISRHWFHFVVGVLMHIGIFVAIVKVIVLIGNPQIAQIGKIFYIVIVGIGAICALYLLLKRIASTEMRSISCPDDYISILFVLDYLAVSMANGFGWVSAGALLIHASVLFVYIPLGKLRHAVYFFIARADFGARMGYRGTYPVK